MKKLCFGRVGNVGESLPRPLRPASKILPKATSHDRAPIKLQSDRVSSFSTKIARPRLGINQPANEN